MRNQVCCPVRGEWRQKGCVGARKPDRPLSPAVGFGHPRGVQWVLPALGGAHSPAARPCRFTSARRWAPRALQKHPGAFCSRWAGIHSVQDGSVPFQARAVWRCDRFQLAVSRLRWHLNQVVFLRLSESIYHWIITNILKKKMLFHMPTHLKTQRLHITVSVGDGIVGSAKLQVCGRSIL